MEENRFLAWKKTDFGFVKNQILESTKTAVLGSEKNRFLARKKNTFEFVRDLFKAKVVKKASWLGKNRF